VRKYGALSCASIYVPAIYVPAHSQKDALERCVQGCVDTVGLSCGRSGLFQIRLYMCTYTF